MKENNYAFFNNRQCEFHPCHGRDEMNCLFCICPLYLTSCGGNYSFTEKGLKDCSQCFLPHDPEAGYDFVLKKLSKIIKEKH